MCQSIHWFCFHYVICNSLTLLNRSFRITSSPVRIIAKRKRYKTHRIGSWIIQKQIYCFHVLSNGSRKCILHLKICILIILLTSPEFKFQLLFAKHLKSLIQHTEYGFRTNWKVLVKLLLCTGDVQDGDVHWVLRHFLCNLSLHWVSKMPVNMSSDISYFFLFSRFSVFYNCLHIHFKHN